MIKLKYSKYFSRIWYTIWFLALCLITAFWFVMSFGYKEYQSGQKSHTELYKEQDKMREKINHIIERLNKYEKTE